MGLGKFEDLDRCERELDATINISTAHRLLIISHTIQATPTVDIFHIEGVSDFLPGRDPSWSGEYQVQLSS
ncbi:hypothetical protein BDR07DRAFT_1413015 [Suillus spraguei]|nr:hypothetical protein BDR07DRAFT_1413015 [Suillus spraguei]